MIKYPKNNIQEIINFYDSIFEFTLLFPIYYNKDLNTKEVFESNENVLKRNFFILFNLYNDLKKQKLNNNYIHNFFFKEIHTFMHYFNQLLPSINIKKKLEEKEDTHNLQITDKKEYQINDENEEKDSSNEDSFGRNKVKRFSKKNKIKFI